MVETGGLAAKEKATWNASREAQRSTSNTTLLAGIIVFSPAPSGTHGPKPWCWCRSNTVLARGSGRCLAAVRALPPATGDSILVGARTNPNLEPWLVEPASYGSFPPARPRPLYRERIDPLSPILFFFPVACNNSTQVGFGVHSSLDLSTKEVMAEEKGALQSAREWVVEHKLRAVGTFLPQSPLFVLLLASSPLPSFNLRRRPFLTISVVLVFVLQGALWLSGIVGSIAYNWSRPGMKTSVKLIHARLHAQALTLAALGGSALVEYYDHHKGSGSKVHQYAKQFLSSDSSSQKE
ncbi:hypothetical protein PR202_gb21997 [Eleusine coracana subsp. coracana]|uniref:HIG1 domain-containing protein n=1 Tax=Eleusine coracana subsp. coracana TaxID=191504 RepID=A0AAV5FG51_ELECO|nr:hypothetical protein PR202_gb21997 [Eleusine coracana subsp. coracana]